MDEASAGNERLKTNARWLSEEQRRLVGNTRLGLVYDAFARKMQAAFRRAEGLGKLRRDGQLDSRLEEELAKALGIDPKVVEGGKEGVADGTDLTTDAEAQAMQSADAVADGGDADAAVGPSAEGDLGEASFSLKPHNRTDLDSLVKEAAQPGNAPSWAETSLPDAQRTLLEKVVGHSLDGYIRAVDLSGVRHVDKRHGSRSNDPHPVTEADLAALPEIVAAPGAVSLAPRDGKNVTSIQHVRFYNGSWYYYTEEVRTGKNGSKALVLAGLRKAPEKKVASSQTSSAEAGSITSETLLAEARARLLRSNEDFNSKRRSEYDVQSETGGPTQEASDVFLDEGVVGVEQKSSVSMDDLGEVSGTGRHPTVKWEDNSDGSVREIDEVRALAVKWGVTIPDDIDFAPADPGSLGEDIYARYGVISKKQLPPSKQMVTWKQFYNVHDKIMIQLDTSLLKSDEGIVGIVAHEMHELNNLRRLFAETADQKMTLERLAKLISADHDGQLHLEAWGVSDKIITEMKKSKKQ